MVARRTNPALRDIPETLAAWSLVLADNVHLRVGNGPTAIGKPKALLELAALLDHVETLGTGYREVLRSGETVVVETTLLLNLRESVGEVPCALIARSEHGLMSDLRFYLDLSVPWPDGADSH